MLKRIQKSIFINIFSSIAYLKILIIFFLFIARKFNIFLLESFISSIFYMYASFITCIIGACFEIKNFKTNEYIITIPEKILKTKWYKYLFKIGFTISTLIFIVFSLFIISLFLVTSFKKL